LMAAARDNWIEGARLLANIDTVNMTDKEGKTALMYAAHLLHWDMTKLLESRGGDANVKDKSGNNACALALQRAPWTSTEDNLVGRAVSSRYQSRSRRGGDRYCTRCTNSAPFSIGGKLCGFYCTATHERGGHCD
jgi:hypothetical protein